MGMLLRSVLLVWAQPGLLEGITEVEVRSDGPSRDHRGGGVPPHLSQDKKLDREHRRKKQKRWSQKETSLEPTGGSCSSFRVPRLPAPCRGLLKGPSVLFFSVGKKKKPASESKLADFSCSLNPSSLFIILPLPKTQAVFRSHS